MAQQVAVLCRGEKRKKDALHVTDRDCAHVTALSDRKRKIEKKGDDKKNHQIWYFFRRKSMVYQGESRKP